MFATIEEEATDEELDMLDLAFGLTDTSRLGCQVLYCAIAMRCVQFTYLAFYFK